MNFSILCLSWTPFLDNVYTQCPPAKEFSFLSGPQIPVVIPVFLAVIWFLFVLKLATTGVISLKAIRSWPWTQSMSEKGKYTFFQWVLPTFSNCWWWALPAGSIFFLIEEVAEMNHFPRNCCVVRFTALTVDTSEWLYFTQRKPSVNVLLDNKLICICDL